MHRQTVAIASRSGLHARPASLFVQAAARQPVKVTIAREGRDPVEARSMLAVLALAATHGETVELSAEGDGARAAIEELAELLARDLDAT
ncbi:HPr family phosphocarrier protein [Streptomyces sp. CA-278952]|uniref:HPr family phosphocarrier protein n=1 Tax=unclassified Streptomyces TaxID=2593676 RepID=UPI0022419BE3|nr:MULTISPECIES: HPr family phosphocarrier protein [unclassified Streptomyces]UZI33315.1 HPr family phosphocarrier protein [Streptomyces sp. VB1]WDG33199.1 HPr family phosphocarrier protein [Streptomyces sp. CA-278952]